MKDVKQIAVDAANEWIKHSDTNNSLLDACALHGYICGFLAGHYIAKNTMSKIPIKKHEWHLSAKKQEQRRIINKNRRKKLKRLNKQQNSD